MVGASRSRGGEEATEQEEIEQLLDGPLGSYSRYRWAVHLLLGGAWCYAAEAFLETFIAHPVGVERCGCPLLPSLGNASLADACAACAAAGSALQCDADPTTIAASFGLYCEYDWMRTVPPTAYFVGCGLGSLCSCIADSYGRRPAFVGARTLSALIFLLSAASPSLATYMACKLAIGFTTTLGTMASYPLACELVGSTLRTRLTVELWCYVWAIACCYLALQSYFMRGASWRMQAVASSVPYALLALGYIFLLPESPRWLAMNGRRAEAHAVIGRLLGKEDVQLLRRSPGCSAELLPIEPIDGDTLPVEGDTPKEGGGTVARATPRAASTSSTIQSAAATREPGSRLEAAPESGLEAVSDSGLEAASDSAAPTRHAASNAKRRLPALELFSSPASARAMLILMYLWATVSLSYYAIGYNAGNLSEQARVGTLTLTLASPPFRNGRYTSTSSSSRCLYSSPPSPPHVRWTTHASDDQARALTLDPRPSTVNPRPSTLHPQTLDPHPHPHPHPKPGTSALFFGCIALTIGVGALWPSIATASSVLGNLVAMAAFNVVYVMTAETFPTSHRSSALGLCSAAGRAGSLFSSPLPGILGSTATLAIISMMCALAVVATKSGLPETRGRGLAERLPGH